MHKQIAVMLTFLLALTCVMFVQAPSALADSQTDFIYNLEIGQAIISGYTGGGGAISIPDTIDGHTVTAIMTCAFSGNTDITSVVVPQGITVIGASAFEGCAKLSAIYFRGDAPALGNNALAECAVCLKIYYPSDASGWADTWNGCAAQAYDLSATYTVTYDVNGAVVGNAAVDASSYPTGEAVTVLGNTGGMAHLSDTFDGWDTQANGKGAKYAADNTFAITGNITLYTQWKQDLTPGTPTISTADGIQWSYTPLGQDYCEITNCSPVPANLQIPANINGRRVVRIGQDAFRECPDLMEVTLPDSVTRIGSSAFYLCENLVSITFPSGITDIGGYAFACCSRLTTAVFTGDAPAISDSAFSDCSLAFKIFYQDATQGWTDPYDGIVVETYSPSDTYTVNYDLNGGTGDVPVDAASHDMGDVVTAPGWGSMANGYNSFYGWSTDPNTVKDDLDRSIMKDGDRFAVTGNVTLYAIWYINDRPANNQKHVVVDGLAWDYLPIGDFFCSIYKFTPASGNIIIPAFIDGRLVTDVLQNAFGYNEDITSVVIPLNVVNVNRYAFQYCSELTRIIFQGDAPTTETTILREKWPIMTNCAADLTIYYPSGAKGWASPWNSIPTKSYDPEASFSITYNGNGAQTGSLPSGMFSHQALTAVTILGNTGNLTKANYYFDGWNTRADGKGTDYAMSGKLILTGNTTLYAVWKPVTCTISFDRQSGSVVIKLNADYGTSIAAPANPTRTGYTFTGWYTKATGGVKVTFPYTVLGNTTLYAIWSPVPCVVGFNRQDGSAVTTQTVHYSAYLSPPADPARTGYTFNGWFDAPTGGTKATFPCKIYANTMLYAQWTINSYLVKFNSQGGTAVPSITVKFNTTTAAPATPARAGCVFVGWYKDTAYVNAWNFKSNVVTGNITLYAKWLVTPASVKANSVSYTSIKVSWGAAPGASGYEVYRCASPTGTYTLLKTVTGTEFTDAGLSTNKKYYYKVRAFTTYITTARIYSGYSAVVSAVPVLSTPAGVKATPASASSIKLTWGAVAGSAHYEVWRSSSLVGTYTLITTTGAVFCYTNSHLKANTVYYYKVKTYCTVGVTKVYSGFSAVVYARTMK